MTAHPGPPRPSMNDSRRDLNTPQKNPSTQLGQRRAARVNSARSLSFQTARAGDRRTSDLAGRSIRPPQRLQTKRSLGTTTTKVFQGRADMEESPCLSPFTALLALSAGARVATDFRTARRDEAIHRHAVRAHLPDPTPRLGSWPDHRQSSVPGNAGKRPRALDTRRGCANVGHRSGTVGRKKCRWTWRIPPERPFLPHSFRPGTASS